MPALDFVQRSSGLPAMAESGVDIRNPKYAASRPQNVECAVQGVVSEQGRACPRKQDGFVLETSSNSSTTSIRWISFAGLRRRYPPPEPRAVSTSPAFRSVNNTFDK